MAERPVPISWSIRSFAIVVLIRKPVAAFVHWVSAYAGSFALACSASTEAASQRPSVSMTLTDKGFTHRNMAGMLPKQITQSAVFACFTPE